MNKQLPFRMPQFCRISWISREAQARWAERLERARTAVLLADILGFSRHEGRCAWFEASDARLVQISALARAQGLEVITVSGGRGGMLAALSARDSGSDYRPIVVVGSPRGVATFSKAWIGGKPADVLKLAGWPGCCAARFQEIQAVSPARETTRAYAESVPHVKFGDLVLLKAPWPTHHVLRPLGIRKHTHLPCGPDCEESSEDAQARDMELAKHGWQAEVLWVQELLSWPIEWSSLHGIAEIKVPLFKVAWNTDALARKVTIRVPSTIFPDCAVQGLMFPYKGPSRLSISDSQAFKRGIDEVQNIDRGK